MINSISPAYTSHVPVIQSVPDATPASSNPQADAAAGTLAAYMRTNGVQTLDPNDLYNLAQNTDGHTPPADQRAARYMLGHMDGVWNKIETNDVAHADGVSGVQNLEQAAQGLIPYGASSGTDEAASSDDSAQPDALAGLGATAAATAAQLQGFASPSMPGLQGALAGVEQGLGELPQSPDLGALGATIGATAAPLQGFSSPSMPGLQGALAGVEQGVGELPKSPDLGALGATIGATAAPLRGVASPSMSDLQGALAGVRQGLGELPQHANNPAGLLPPGMPTRDPAGLLPPGMPTRGIAGVHFKPHAQGTSSSARGGLATLPQAAKDASGTLAAWMNSQTPWLPPGFSSKGMAGMHKHHTRTMDPDTLYQLAIGGSKNETPEVEQAAKYMLGHSDAYKTIAGAGGIASVGDFETAAQA